ncbi:hypothetical protein BT96DRAFT_929420 [Gymnopus androsaceus JB14]|uniref:Uncharacterized protein n=1 Tax=Gymnopus androsaceus JB14 TaxID=1447944 RepID=A0A6A4GFP5_9AGAR|nr:hypothetical protein BT96DRAFT_929420 [Gymnopus androsaceus JB14]
MRFPIIITALSGSLILLLTVGQVTASDGCKAEGQACSYSQTPELPGGRFAGKKVQGQGRTQVAHNGALKTE